MKDNHLKYVYNQNKVHYYEAVSDRELPVGDVKVSFVSTYNKETDQAEVKLYIDDKEAGVTIVEQFAYMVGFSTSLLANPYSPVTPDYESPFEFTGRADKIVLHQFADVVDVEEEKRKLSSIE